MNFKKGITSIHIIIYFLIYISFFFIISILHLSFSTNSILSISIPFIIFVIGLLFLSKKNSNKIREHKRVIMLVSIPPLLCLTLLGFNEYNSKFNLERWINKSSDRVFMVDNLFDKHELKGMVKKDVYNLLGIPDYENKDNLGYYLGTEQGLVKIDSEVLIIELNDKDIVTNYKVITD